MQRDAAALSPTRPSPPRASRTWAERVFGRWWRRQSAARQDRYATLGPLASVLLFLAAIVSAFWYLRNEEFEREQEAVRRDTEVSQQQLRLHLIENQEQLARIARELVTRTLDREGFLVQASVFTRDHAEISNLMWVDAARRNISDARAAFLQQDLRQPPPTLTDLDFVIMNPPFHEGGGEDKHLGQTFIGTAAAMLRKGGVCRLVANVALPYEAALEHSFATVTFLARGGGYKVFEARR